MGSGKRRVKANTGGFTLIELLVVIAVIALLMAVIMPALGKAKIQAMKVVCGNHQKQLGLSLLMYADDNKDALMNYYAGWMWDVSYAATDHVIETGGDRRTFYCPLDKTKRSDMIVFWRFGENPSLDATESSMPPEPVGEARERKFRVTGYFWLMDRENSANIPMLEDCKFEWAKKITDIKNASTQELITDATISQGTDPRTAKFTEIEGTSYQRWGIYDRTNHINHEGKPTDTDILFADGHVSRRHFEDTKPWLGSRIAEYMTSGSPIHWW